MNGNCRSCRYYLPNRMDCLLASNSGYGREMVKIGLIFECKEFKSDKEKPPTKEA